MAPHVPFPTRRSGGPAVRRSATVISVITTLSTLVVVPAVAQYPDASILRRGMLRVGFEPHYINYGDRFGPDGEVELLGTDLTADSAGPSVIPTMTDAQMAVRSIVGDPSYVMSAGAFQTTLDADVRRFPLNVALGITDRLTLTASIPIVTTRMQADFVADSANGNVGWNQATPESGNAVGLSDIQALVSQLEAAIASVNAQIGAGGYGCPTSMMCDQARDLVSRASQLSIDLILLTGVNAAGAVDPDDPTFPPFAPTTASTAGQALLSAIQSIAAELVTFGAPAVTATLPLPSERVATDDVQSMFGSPSLGYDAFPIEFVRYTRRLGDAEIGLRWGAVQNPSLRTVLKTTVRLPTGLHDAPDNFIDIGTGNSQTDLEAGIEAYWAPGSMLAVAVDATYTVQLGDNLPRRVTPSNRPIALAISQVNVSRNLGDYLRVSVHPSIRLSRAFTAYGSAQYFYKRTDRFSVAAGATLPTDFPGAVGIEALEEETKMRTLSFGGGIHYRSTERRHTTALPIEAGVDYRAALSGSGGLTPKTISVNFYLRLFFQLFGGDEASGDTPEASEER